MIVYTSPEPGDGGSTPVYAVEPKKYPFLSVRRRGLSADMNGVEELDPRFDLAERSPSGFAWGYGGSGPAQLALAILAHACSEETATREYQRFKEKVIAKQAGDEPLLVTESDVKNFLNQ